MCSVATMPTDYDLMVAHSPPIFSHSPPSYYPSYNTCRMSSSPSTNRLSPKPSPTLLRRSTSLQKTSIPNLSSVPRRPCLILKHDDSSSSSEDDCPSPTRVKKRVVFADDKGLSLTQVRLMTEPSYMPPCWNSQFLKLVTQGISVEVSPEPWECLFSQPASDYLEFRRRLEEGFVSLENVIVRESAETVTGTIKVKNLTFAKEVFVRSSADSWMTQEDTFCTYMNNTNPALPGAVIVIYDTFSFKLTLPPRSRKIEFCVCYRCDGKEYWDSNGGKNYVIVKKAAGAKLKSSDPMPIPSHRYNDAAFAKVDSWSEFASWTHLTNDGPYW